MRRYIMYNQQYVTTQYSSERKCVTQAHASLVALALSLGFGVYAASGFFEHALAHSMLACREGKLACSARQHLLQSSLSWSGCRTRTGATMVAHTFCWLRCIKENPCSQQVLEVENTVIV